MIDLPAQARIALAHDWLVGWRGGEQVLDRLASLVDPICLYTLVARGSPLSPALGRCRVVTSPLQRLPGAAGRLRRAYLPVMPWAVSRIRVAPCDLLISTSSAVIKSIRPPPGTAHLCYCHTPARYLWEQQQEYGIGAGGAVRRMGLGLLGGPLRRWDRRTADRVTRFLANSSHTAARIRRCYGRDAAVVHPPVRTGFFTPDPGVARQPWLLVVSALEPYKRVDLAIEAANRAGFRLRVVGGGSQEAALRALAGPTVQLMGRVDEATLRKLYREAAALIFPQQEDFGIAAVEAQATGCPVLAYRSGGALETVGDDTGILFERQSAEAIIDAVAALRDRAFDPQACRAGAERFDVTTFDAAMMRHIAEMIEESD